MSTLHRNVTIVWVSLVSGAGDIDGDDISNANEYAAVVSYGGSIDTFAQVALYWDGPGPLPVAGIVGLGALASVIALVGVRKVKRVKCEG